MDSEQKKNLIKGWPVYLAFAILATIGVWTARMDNKNKQNQPLNKTIQKGFENKAQLTALEKIVKEGRTWGPTWTQWYGKAAPDFTVTTIEGKQITLSQLKGKKVLLIYWATWCRYCVSEIPGLIELRNQQSSEDLAIIALSNEEIGLIKPFVTHKAINYDIVAQDKAMPEPLGTEHADGLPSAVFIDSKGIIRLSSVGLMKEDTIIKVLELMD